MARGGDSSVVVHWIPLGAGAHVVRVSGRIYEALVSLVQRRPRCALYHAALVVEMPGGPVTIEVTPVPTGNPAARGVVGTGPVGMRWLGRLRVFRYELRRWPGGTIPDLASEVGPPHVVPLDEAAVARFLDRVEAVPRPTWGRDELGAGEMWNSNSVVSWLLDQAGLEVEALGPPPGGRAPGWDAGLVVSRRVP
jgi:hypothetical protein